MKRKEITIKKTVKKKAKRFKKLKTPKLVSKPSLLVSLPEKIETSFKYDLQPPFVSAEIVKDKENNELIYNVIQPQLNDEEKNVYNKIVEGLLEILDIELSSIKKEEVRQYLDKKIDSVLKELDIKISKESYLRIMYYVYRNFVGLNEIEPFIHDPYIEDISCDGIGIPIFIVHRRYGSIKTNILYNDEKDLKEFVVKLAERCGRFISYAEPLLDGSLPDGSRVQASFSSDVTTRGPSFTVRKFVAEPLSPIDLLNNKTVSSEVLAYLWLAVENGASILVIGGAASGKTTFINVLTTFIRPNAKIVSVEDTRELQLQHENWIAAATRAGFVKGYGEVTLFDLLKESFRQSPDYVIVGEIRGEEAYVMFQGMASLPLNEKVAILNDNHLKRVPIGELAYENGFKTFAVDQQTGKILITPIECKVMHDKSAELYRLVTKSGREVLLTDNHSILCWKNGIQSLRVDELNIGDYVIIPSVLPAALDDRTYINLLDFLPDIRVYAPTLIKKAVKRLGYEKASQICEVSSISDYYSKFKRSKPSALPFYKFKKLMEKAKIDYSLTKLTFRFLKKSKSMSAIIPVTSEFLRLLGYYVSEGGLDRSQSNRISLWNSNRIILDDMKKCIQKVLKIKPKETTKDGKNFQISFNHKVFFEFLKRICGIGSKNKKIPDFIFGLSKTKIGHFLSALFAGDGYFSEQKTGNYKFGYTTSSDNLASDILYILLFLGIIGRAKRRIRKFKGKLFPQIEINIHRADDQKELLKYISLIKKDVAIIKNSRNRFNYLENIFKDRIIKLDKIKLHRSVPVYDLSVPKYQNFLGGFGGLFLHNSGMPAMGTMHAGNVDDVINRLETPPINLSPSLVATLDVVVLMAHAREHGESARRVQEIVEIESIDSRTGAARTNIPYYWLASQDMFSTMATPTSALLQKIEKNKGLSSQKSMEEIRIRTKILEWMQKNNTTHFKDVVSAISQYYKDPKRFLAERKITTS